MVNFSSHIDQRLCLTGPQVARSKTTRRELLGPAAARAARAAQDGHSPGAARDRPQGRAGAKTVAEVFFWRRAFAVTVLAVAVVGGWGALDRLLSSAVPSRASTVSCQYSMTGCRAARPPVTYIAKPGDTLWTIAVRFSGGADPRPLEYRLEQQIGGGTLQPGQVLRLPSGVAA